MGNTQQVANTVVTSDRVYRRKKWPWGWLALVAVGIILNILLVAFLFDHHTHKTSSSTGKGMHQLVTAQQQLDAAVASAQATLKDATTASQKAEAYKDLGMVYFNERQYPNAINAYTSAISTDNAVKPEVLDTLAYTYAVNGQRDQAIALYQELISAAEQQPTAGHEALNYQEGSAVQAYQHNIQMLQQGDTL